MNNSDHSSFDPDMFATSVLAIGAGAHTLLVAYPTRGNSAFFPRVGAGPEQLVLAFVQRPRSS